MARLPTFNMDLKEVQEKITAQFTGLDPNDPSLWPVLPRNVLFVVVSIAVVTALWFSWLSTVDETLVAERAREEQLRNDFRQKAAQAANLDALKRQLDQVQQYVNQLERQLPSKAEMDALLSDINQAGIGRSLQFEVFRPGQVEIKEYYAELPIEVRLTGTYHDMGLFAGDIASLSRIVTLHNLSLTPIKDRPGFLTLDGTARTFRYLDEEELAQQQQKSKEVKN